MAKVREIYPRFRDAMPAPNHGRVEMDIVQEQPSAVVVSFGKTAQLRLDYLAFRSRDLHATFDGIVKSHPLRWLRKKTKVKARESRGVRRA